MLAKYRAFRFIKVLESGRTSPLLLECEAVDDTGELRAFVVKARGLPEVGDYELFVETLGFGDGQWNTKVREHMMSIVENPETSNKSVR